tara:strand:- start:11 stop:184 length:174 start_codon:yes stop_codon:yes gene_type:complete
MAKYKAKKYISQFGSYKGLDNEDWKALNRGEVVELKVVPDEAKEYLEKVNSSKKESK